MRGKITYNNKTYKYWTEYKECGYENNGNIWYWEDGYIKVYFKENKLFSHKYEHTIMKTEIGFGNKKMLLEFKKQYPNQKLFEDKLPEMIEETLNSDEVIANNVEKELRK